MSSLKIDFSGKRILVTGASSGMGKETAIALANNGAEVILVGRDEQRLEALCRSLPNTGHGFYPFDLGRINKIIAFLKEIVPIHGQLSGIFHSAGIECILPINMIKESHMDSVFSVSLKAGLMLAKGFNLSAIHAQGDKSFVFMSSVSALRGQQGLSVYAASKGAIESTTRALAVELAPKSIRVNSIMAGAIQTEMHERIIGNLSEKGIREYESKHLLGFGEASDIANGALYLLSEASKWVTGTALCIDGGYIA